MTLIQRLSQHLLLSLLPLTMLIAAQSTLLGASLLEDQINRYCKAFLADDFSSFLGKLEPQQKSTIEQQWQIAKDGIRKDDAHTFNASMSLLRGENAQEQLFNLAAPYLGLIDVEESSSYVRKLSQVIAQNARQNAEQMSEDEKHLINTFLIVADDAAQWLKNSKLSDSDKLGLAITVLCKTAEQLHLADMDALKSLSLEDALTRLSTLSKGLKEVCSIYDVDMNAFFGSFLASGTEIDSHNRTLALAFTAFGKSHNVRLHVVLEGERWILEGQTKQYSRTP